MNDLATMSSVEAAKLGISRKVWLLAVSKPVQRKAKEVRHGSRRHKAPAFNPNYPCTHRSVEPVGTTICETCGGGTKVSVFGCTKHGKCTIKNLAREEGVKLCQLCFDRQSFKEEVPFASWNNRFAGQEAWVIGSGPTTFNYENLADVKMPIFFINNAATWQRYATHDDLFWFALDNICRPWLPDIKGTAVLDLHGQWGTDRKSAHLVGGQRMSFWRNTPGLNGGSNYHDNQRFLQQSRDELAVTGELYKYMSSIMPLIHFGWYSGISKMNLVGCDGICKPDAMYDERLLPFIRTGPPIPRSYGSVKVEQDRVMRTLGIEANYVGSPTN